MPEMADRHSPRSDIGLRLQVRLRVGLYCRCSVCCLPTVWTRNSRMFSPLESRANQDQGGKANVSQEPGRGPPELQALATFSSKTLKTTK